MSISLGALQNSSTGRAEVISNVVLITVREKTGSADPRWICRGNFYLFAEISSFVCTWVCLFYLSRLFTGCLEFGLLASLFDLLVLGQAVSVLSAHWVILLPQDLPAWHTTRRKSTTNTYSESHYTSSIAELKHTKFKFYPLEECFLFFCLFFLLSVTSCCSSHGHNRWMDKLCICICQRVLVTKLSFKLFDLSMASRSTALPPPLSPPQGPSESLRQARPTSPYPPAVPPTPSANIAWLLTTHR